MTHQQIYGSPLPLCQAFTYFYEHDREWKLLFSTALGREATIPEIREAFEELTDPESYVSYVCHDLETLADQLQLFTPLLSQRRVPNSSLICYSLTPDTVLIGKKLQEFSILPTSTPFIENDVQVKVACTNFELLKIPYLRSIFPQLYCLTLSV